MNARLLLLFLASLAGLAPCAAGQTDYPVPPAFLCDRGPFRIRNQFPLSLHFLSFPGEDARMLGNARWALDFHVTTANTFVQTGDLEMSRASGSRLSLTREEFNAVVNAHPGQDQFLFDGEVTRASFLLRYGLTDRVELHLEIPYISLGGGSFDGFIQGFHKSFGIPQGGRTLYPRNHLQIALSLEGKTVFLGNDAETDGLGDAVMSAKVLVLPETRNVPATAIRVAAKPPTGRSRSLLSSGHSDYGLNLLLAKHYRRQTFYLNFGYVVSGDWWVIPDLPIANVWTFLVAYEHSIGPAASVVLQDLVHSSFLAKATDAELSDPSHEVTLGIKVHSFGKVDWVISVTENYATFNSSPDFGLHVGVVCAF